MPEVRLTGNRKKATYIVGGFFMSQTDYIVSEYTLKSMPDFVDKQYSDCL